MRRTEFSKGSIKRLKKRSLQEDIVLDSKESRRNAITQETGYKKRIKQKSLSAIFAKKWKEANPVILNSKQQSQIPSQNKGVTAKATESKKIKQSATNKRDEKSDKIRINSDFTNEPTVSFVKAKGLARKKDDSKHESKKSPSDRFSSQLKNYNESDTLNLIQKHDIPKNNFKLNVESKVAKESSVLKSNKIFSTNSFDSTDESSFTKATKGRKYIGKTLLAKKKDGSKSELKKSLSDIFSNQLKNQNESGILNLTEKHDISKANFKSDKQNKVVSDDSPVLKNTKETDILNKKKERKERNKKRSLNKDWKSDKTPKLMHKGKASSLFGNNPDIPTIGQRLVKPVNEPVFTEITFADLNIHPFMVSICI